MGSRGSGPTSLEDFGELLYPHEAEEPILSRPVRGALMEWITEIRAKEELAEVGLKPRTKALFTGPPGVGKTTLAHHLAARLQLPLVVVRTDRLIDAYIGSTGRNIGALFDIASAAEPSVLLIDEFDSLGFQRRGAQQGADDERNNSINTLLQRLERYDGFLIATTNRDDTIDTAIWRRFDMQIAIQMPGPFERERILERYLAPYRIPPEPMALLAQSFAEGAPALMRQFCEGLKRQLVIGPKVGWDMDRERVIARMIAAVAPHPSLPQPRLWRLGPRDPAVADLPWPLVAEKKPVARKAAA